MAGVRLNSCHGRYLMATDVPYLTRMTGKIVVQGDFDMDSDWKFEWELIRNARDAQDCRYGTLELILDARDFRQEYGFGLRVCLKELVDLRPKVLFQAEVPWLM